MSEYINKCKRKRDQIVYFDTVNRCQYIAVRGPRKGQQCVQPICDYGYDYPFCNMCMKKKAVEAYSLDCPMEM